jgi:type I restriction enzyme, S subunit
VSADNQLPPNLPKLPSGWQYEPLGELIDRERGISYGVVQPGSHVANGVPIVRVNNIRENRIVNGDVLRIKPEIETKYGRTRLRGGEVVLSLVGSLGQCAVVPSAMKGWNTARAVAVIPALDDPGSHWIELCLRSPLLQRYVQMWATTTVQATLNLRDVALLPLPLPPPGEREQIIGVLRPIDDKIELNRRMNETLDATARAIFKSWFIDFDLQQGSRTPPSQGWKKGRFAEIAAVGRDSISPAEFQAETFDHYSIPAFDEHRLPVSETGEAIKSNKFIVSSDAVFLSKLNPRIPRVWMPDVQSGRRSICSTEFIVLRHKQISREYLFGLCTSDAFSQEFATMVTGTSGSHQRVKPEFVEAIEVSIPDTATIQHYTELVAPIHRRVALNLRESQTLSALRDTLLPKLLSGEVRVKQGRR